MLGFVIVSHREPGQLLRLVTVLNRLYRDPPIACHHDFSQSPLDIARIPDNVLFVQPSVRTGWAKWSVVEATLQALALLYRTSDPDWFVLLSAADYPVMPAQQVLDELRSTSADAFLDYREVGETTESAQRHGPGNPELGHFEAAGNRALNFRRYTRAQLWLPILRRTDKGIRIGRHTFQLPFAAPGGMFTPDFRCYHGDHWFTGNRRVAQLLLQRIPRYLKLQRHLWGRASPDETYYQTVIANVPDLTINRNNKRYAKWNGGGAHPQDLTVAELDLILASGAHFARKFRPDDPVLDRLDAILGAGQKAATDQDAVT